MYFLQQSVLSPHGTYLLIQEGSVTLGTTARNKQKTRSKEGSLSSVDIIKRKREERETASYKSNINGKKNKESKIESCRRCMRRDQYILFD